MIKWISTRSRAPSVDFISALNTGLAPDGGLYIPEAFPSFNETELKTLPVELPKLAQAIFENFCKGTLLEKELSGICTRAFSFPVPVKSLNPWIDRTSVLELFHGPTAAFKDVGARFLAETLGAIPHPSPKRTVLVATSGDTGGAVAAAFDQKTAFEVVILYPKGRISPRQEKQLTCWSDTIQALRVDGTFDDCQRLVKQAFLDKKLKTQKTLISANSINIGRILPQTIYYASASLAHYRQTGNAPGFIIPSGNLGNATGALWAKKMGFPIEKVILAHNANHGVPDFLKSGTWQDFPTLSTLANAMDVARPSNLERIRAFFTSTEDLQRHLMAISVSDEQIQGTIKQLGQNGGPIFCPHTATAAFVRSTLESKDQTHWIIVATAHPSKFETVVEPLIQKSIPIPRALNDILSKPSRFTDIQADFQELEAFLLKSVSR